MYESQTFLAKEKVSIRLQTTFTGQHHQHLAPTLTDVLMGVLTNHVSSNFLAYARSARIFAHFIAIPNSQFPISNFHLGQK